MSRDFQELDRLATIKDIFDPETEALFSSKKSPISQNQREPIHIREIHSLAAY